MTGDRIKPGDVLLGLPSTGLHTNGYSLARKLFFEVAGYTVKTYVPELDSTAGDELLKVHRSYLKPIQKLLKESLLVGAAHITGGGITDNTPRMLPKGLAAKIDTGSWPVLPVFELLRRLGNIPEDDWRRTFNLGIGMILAVPEKKAAAARRMLDRLKDAPLPDRAGGAPTARQAGTRVVRMKNVAILLSGRGSNFEAIARSVREGNLQARIALVISNVPGAAGLETARTLGLATLSLPSKGVDTDQYAQQVVDALEPHGIELICLAGFMRAWVGRYWPATRSASLTFTPRCFPRFPDFTFSSRRSIMA